MTPDAGIDAVRHAPVVSDDPDAPGNGVDSDAPEVPEPNEPA